jgi:WD40 repeat protein
LGEIYRVEKWKDNIVSFALDSYVKVWTKDLELIESKFLNGYNQISLTVDKDKLYIGDGNGTIRVFNAKFEQENTIKICEDSISDIKIIDEFLFATAFDGTIAAFNLITQQMNAVNVEGQLY